MLTYTLLSSVYDSATKKKVTGWYNQFKAQRAEAAARNQANQEQQQHQGQYYDGGSSQDVHRSNEPIRFGSRTEEDEPLGKRRLDRANIAQPGWKGEDEFLALRVFLMTF